MLTPELQSDVRPVYFRKLRWRGTYFEPLLSNALMRSSPGSNRFAWQKTSESYGTWISKLAPYGDDLAKANVMEYNKDGSFRTGTVLIRFDREGATIERWLEPLFNENESMGSSAVGINSEMTSSSQGSNTYRARLSYSDHQNSGGKRLVKVKDVLRQDRANLYKRGGDSEDQRDPYFHTGKGRNTMEWIEMHPVDRSYASMKEIIVNGTPLVEVEIRKNGLHVKIIQK